MEIIFIIGIALIAMVATDLLLTTLQSGGAGFISGPVSALLWRLFLRLSGNDGSSKFLNYAGMLIVLKIIALWVFGLWGGFLLLYLTQPDSIVASISGESADFWEKVYYSGFTLSTLGIGDFVPGNNLFRVITAFNSLSGLILITMALTYLIPLLSAVTFQRTLSAYIHSLGDSPIEILGNAWDGKSLSRLEPYLENLEEMILSYSEKHMAYPVVHYFHRNKPRFSAPLHLVRLKEALELALEAFHEDQIGNVLLFQTAKQALTEYFNTMGNSYTTKAASISPPDYQKHLKEAFPNLELLYDEESFNARRLKERLLMKGLVEMDGWDWKMVN